MSSTYDLPESEVDFGKDIDFGSNAWIVRPCLWYRLQYIDCKSIRARAHQYFIFGETIDCKDWKKDFENCLQFRNSQKPEDLQKVIESELNRREERLKSSVANDVWIYRSEPPKDWLKPLPDWFTQRNKYSFLSRKQTERENESKNNLNKNKL